MTALTHHTSHITVTHVTVSIKRNYISSDAHFSGLSEYPSPMIYNSFLIEKIAKHSKKGNGAKFFRFPKWEFFYLI
jgi:hypothetical protein